MVSLAHWWAAQHLFLYLCESDSTPTSILSRLNVLVVTTKADSKTAGNRVLFRVVNVNSVFLISHAPVIR